MLQLRMIRSFRNKALEAFFIEGKAAGIRPEHRARIRRLLAMLNQISRVEDIETTPGQGFHRLKGGRLGEYALRVSGNWRLTFKLENEEVVDIDYLDYH